MTLIKYLIVLVFSTLLALCGLEGAQENGEGFLLGAVMLLIGSVFIYIFPSWVAGQRDIVNEYSVVMTNLLWGWTIAGWVIALYWALTDPTSRDGRAKKRIAG